MKIRHALLLALLMMSLLTACTNAPVSTVSSSTPDEIPNSNTPISTESVVPKSNDQLLAEKYVDVSRLAVSDADIKDKYVFDDRTLTLEDSIDNELEHLVYQSYYDSVSFQFEDYLDLIGEDKSLQGSVQNEADNCRDGLYMSEYNIHKLTILTADDLATISDFSKQDIIKKIDTYGFTEYAIVQADVSWKHNKASLANGPQIGDGRYMRYYLLATTTNVSEFKIYEVYWEDFIAK
ncbi:MAG: hypothetical protein RR814_07995 [Oscillospiraceae bacterium]